MKRSQYLYFFEIDNEYVGYSYLSDSFVSFPIEKKARVEDILKYPDEIITNADATIYKTLCDKKCLINNDFSEYDFLMRRHRQFIYNNDLMILTIIPTMACNCRCPYCYELHTKAKISPEVIDNLKKLITNKIKTLRHLRIRWFGGEPLIYIDTIKEISEFCIDLCEKESVVYHTTIITNGVQLSKKNSQILSNCKINGVQITLDGSKKNHDKTRVLVGGGATFNTIRKNIVNYLSVDEMNKVYLRIHVSYDAELEYIKEIVETLKLFDQKYRERIMAYPHVIFSACSEMWSNESGESCVANFANSREEEASNITNKIYEGIVKLGYGFGFNSGRGIMAACESETENCWVVRPDGYLTNCTVAIEKERALAKLTKEGIKIFSERFYKTAKKEFSTELYEYCKDCKYLPFCWQKCTFFHYQNPDIHKHMQILGCKNNASWIIKRQLNGIINRYVEERAFAPKAGKLSKKLSFLMAEEK